MTTDNRNQSIWYSGATAIGKAIGRNRGEIPRLVAQDGLPAFKFRNKWTATHKDLEEWARKIAIRYKGRRRK